MEPEDSELVRRLIAIGERIEDFCRAIQQNTEAIHAAQEAQQQAKEARNPTPVIVAYDDQTVRATKEENDRQYRTQNSIKNWTKIAVIAASIYAAIAALTYCEIAKQYPELVRSATAAETSANAAYAEMRPWLKINSVELRDGAGPIKTLMFHWPSTEKIVPPQLQVKVSVRNVGHTVAQDVQVFPELFFAKFNGNTWHDVVTKEEERFCNSVVNWKAKGAMAVVFPSDSKDWNEGTGSMIQATENSSAALIICASYEGVPQRSQTQAWFGLYEDKSILIKTDIDVNASRLQLIRDETGDHAY